MKNGSLIISIIFTSLFAYSQSPPDTLWTKAYGGPSNDEARSVIQTIDSCFVFLGHTESPGNTDIWMVKIDNNGSILWNKTFGGDSGDFGASIRQTEDNGFIIIGTTESFGNGDISIWLIKTNEDGNEIWNAVFDETIDNTCQVQFVSQTSDGGYIISGGTGDFTIDHMDAWLIKTNEHGIEEWNKKLGGLGNQKMYTGFETIAGGYILSGLTQSIENGGDVWLVKTDNSGDILWDKTFGGTEWDNAYSMQITSDNGYILAGYTKSFGNGEEDFWLIKTDSQGNEIWNTIYGEDQVDVIYSIQQTQDGGYIAGGLTNSFGATEFDLWVSKVDSQGNIIWSNKIGKAQNEFAFSVSQLFDKGYILAGRTNSFGNGNEDAFVVRIKPETTNTTNNSFDEFSTLKVYPNPFTRATTIKYQLKTHANISHRIYNNNGKEVKTLQSRHHPSGNMTLVWDGTGNTGQLVPAGVYYYRIQIGDKIQYKRILFLKK